MQLLVYLPLFLRLPFTAQDPSNNFTDSSQQSSAGAGHYKQRIRHSAGGGVGPNYKKDTR
jgi:hypothetical protein